MEREIKFRAKCSKSSKYANKWVYGSLVISDRVKPDMIDMPRIVANNNDSPYSIDKGTIGQFTGLQDKNGKDIYEGDIIQLQAKESKFNCLVGWNSELGAWCISIEDKHVGIKPLGEWLCEDKFEVIGNIYDNKDLLED